MKRYKGTGKRLLAIAMTAALVSSNFYLPQSITWAVEEAPEQGGEVIYATSGEWIDLGGVETSSDEGISTFFVQERVAGAEKWIDRVDGLADYAKELYKALEDGVDGVDGDVLIDDESFSKDNAITIRYSDGTAHVVNAIKVYEGALLSADDEAELQKNVRIAYDAFDRDHPEVFWLSGQSKVLLVTTSGSSGSSTTAYFVCKNHSSSNSFDIRGKDYTSEASIRNVIAERDGNISTIIKDAEEKTADYEKLKYFNEWLTKNNSYNSDLNTAQVNYPAAWECVSALKGSTGAQGPVCEGYARAFKVLCDRAGIPCVLVDGKAKNQATSGGEDHMWNYVQVDGAWYAVDVTWNDPVVSGVTTGATSGHESEDWFLVGADSEVNGMKFIESHPVSNAPSEASGTIFVNGPELSAAAYVPKEAPVITFTSTKDSLVYDGSPITADEFSTVSVSVAGAPLENPVLTYSYKSAEDKAYTKGLPTDAGTYEIKVSVASGDTYSSAECKTALKLTIEKQPITVTYPNAVTTIYGTTLKECDLTSESTEYGTFAWTDENTILTAGEHTRNVTFTLKADKEKNYTVENPTGTVTVTVQKATPVVNVTAENDGLDVVVKVTVEKTANGTIPTGTVELYVNETAQGEAVELKDGQASIAYTAPERGEYQMKVSYHAAADSNYVATESVSVTVDTSKKAQTGFAIEAFGDKTYGDAPFALKTTGGNGTGEISFHSSDADVIAVTGGQATIKRVGNVVITAVKAGDENYNEASTQINVVVLPKALTFAADNKTAKVGQAKPEFTYRVIGLVNDDEVKVEPVCSADTANMGKKGKYPITISGAEVENQDCYKITYQDGVLTVTGNSYSYDDDYDDSSSDNYYRPSNNTNTTNTPVKKEDTILQDAKKGKVDPVKGIITGTTNGNAGDGYSHWKSDDKGWWLQYADGTYAAGNIAGKGDGSTYESVAWEMINGEWFCFGADGYAKSGWILDEELGGWFYVDINSGMRTGWLFDGVNWYYLNPESNGYRGRMATDTWTPDGYYVGPDGAWMKEVTR